jgi:hypothetical protein
MTEVTIGSALCCNVPHHRLRIILSKNAEIPTPTGFNE